MDLTGLTRKHGVKIPPRVPVSVEDCSLAVGELVGHSSVKSAARMNNAVVIFLDTIENANIVLEKGIEVGGNFLPVYPLSSPAVRVTVSNVPPFIRDEEITRELSKHGKIESKVRKVSSGCKSPLLKHVVSHRRQLFMIPNNRSRVVNLVFKITVKDFDYVIYATTNDFKCYSCGRMGHQSRTCPEKNGPHRDQNQDQTGTEEGRGDKQDRQEETGGVQKEREEGTSEAQEGASENQEVREEETSETQEGASENQEVGESTGRQVEPRVLSLVQLIPVTAPAPQLSSDPAASASEQQRPPAPGSEVDVEGDEEQLKAPQLRRNEEGSESSHMEKAATATGGSGGAAESESGLEEDSESGLDEESDSGSEEIGAAEAAEICAEWNAWTREERLATAAAASEQQQPPGSEVDMEGDEEQLKAPQLKRRKGEDSEEDAAADGGPSERKGYSVEEIQEYLKKSKGVRGARVEDYVSDQEKLSNSAREHMRSKDRGGLTKQEGFRLVKIIHKVTKELEGDGAK